ncbi:hypothetical protein H4219_003386 [Mycoemilia scoparia]|uniref:Prolyl endopeptidase n=1 Tax=Mycoemilia scoparia TaxID=417184 RepID=A0A9W8DTF9_9FUNG|nr:hypothetical protein H4219_003386 [Mycoemilia scoparia]
MDNKVLYDITWASYGIALFHFLAEIFIFKTSKIPGPVMSTFVVAYPFSWLQNKESKNDLYNYLQKETSYTNKIMKSTRSLQKRLAKEMEEALYVEQTPPPIETVNGPFTYYTKIRSDNGSTLYYRRAINDKNAPEELLVDSVEFLNKEGCSINSILVSPDNSLIGCLLTDLSSYKNRTGNDEHDIASQELGQLRIYKIISSASSSSSLNKSFKKANLEMVGCVKDVLNFVWSTNDAIYFTSLNDKLRSDKVYLHDLNSPSKETSPYLIFEEHDEEAFLDVTKTKDGEYISIYSSTLDSNQVYLIPTGASFKDIKNGSKGKLTPISPRIRGVESFVDHINDEFVVLSNYQPNDTSSSNEPTEARKFSLYKCNDKTLPTAEEWEQWLVLNEEQQIQDVELLKDFIVVFIKRQGLPEIIAWDIAKKAWKQVPLPAGNEVCSVKPNANTFESPCIRFSYHSPTHLDIVADYNLETNKISKKWQSTHIGFNPSDFVCYREKVPSRDKSVQIPVTLIHHRHLEKDSFNPVLFRLYGAYGVPLEPEFRVTDIPLLKRNWIIALAHIRGGNELGPSWYTTGKSHLKPNSVLDFMDCVQYMFDEKWSSPSKMSAITESAGGFVLGTALNKQPDWFRALVMKVPFLDPISSMLDTSLPLTNVEKSEWGDISNDPKIYSILEKYAPYDQIPQLNVSSSEPDIASLPSILITGGWKDQRVLPWQQAKWVAKWRQVNSHIYGKDSMKLDMFNSVSFPKLLLNMDFESGHFSQHQQQHQDSRNPFERHKEGAFTTSFLLREVNGE